MKAPKDGSVSEEFEGMVDLTVAHPSSASRADPPDFKALSDDAKAVLGANFGMMIGPGRGHLTFQTPWNRTERGATALAELVAAGFLTVAEGELGHFAWTYRALVDCTDAFKWCHSNRSKLKGLSMMVPDAQRRWPPPAGWGGLLRATNAASDANGRNKNTFPKDSHG